MDFTDGSVGTAAQCTNKDVAQLVSALLNFIDDVAASDVEPRHAQVRKFLEHTEKRRSAPE